MREWRAKKSLEAMSAEAQSELLGLLAIAMDSEDTRLQRCARELAEKFGIERPQPLADRAPGARFQSLLDKYGTK